VLISPRRSTLTHAELRSLALAVLAAFIAILLFTGCETGGTARVLPAYEPPIAKTEFQHVRTTAYTHTEADHTQYGARNALGGELHAASPAIHRVENVRQARAISDSDDTDVINISSGDAKLEKFSMNKPKKATRVTTTTVTTSRVATTTKARPVITRGGKRAVAVTKSPPRIGSAAADWSRWPVGTTFRLLSTGQMYRVEDYGWALSGRNTIDLYMANRSDMNAWGARQEPIQVLHWGDPRESLQILQSHQGYKHIRRMVLELEGQEQEAAALQ
jgi:3D (Asp-Asp-Asp) domain-containing protein